MNGAGETLLGAACSALALWSVGGTLPGTACTTAWYSVCRSAGGALLGTVVVEHVYVLSPACKAPITSLVRFMRV
jgi:hypothetical protein